MTENDKSYLASVSRLMLRMYNNIQLDGTVATLDPGVRLIEKARDALVHNEPPDVRDVINVIAASMKDGLHNKHCQIGGVK